MGGAINDGLKVMKFDKEKFVDETAGDLGAALGVIDCLVMMLNDYCVDDDLATGNGHGVYGRAHEAEQQFIDNKKYELAAEYLVADLGEHDDRRQTLDELTALSQDLGMYD